MPTTLNIILDTRRMKETTRTFPVKLRVIHDCVTKDFSTVFDLTESQYQSLNGKRVSNDLQAIREQLDEIETNARKAAKDIRPFNFSEFEKDFISSNDSFKARKKRKDLPAVGEALPEFDFTPYHKKFPILLHVPKGLGRISEIFILHVKNLIMEERLGSAENYQSTFSNLKLFAGDVFFSEINAEFLNRFEKWMLGRNRSLGTVGIQLRPLRAVFNIAIEEGIIRKEKCYPFGKGRLKYQIPSSRNVKKAIHVNEVGKLYYHETADIDEEKARDFWLFGYYANGMNVKDIVNLRYKDFQEDYFVFLRAKTARSTRQDPKPITVYLCDELKAIIQKWGNQNTDPNEYVFPILNSGMSPLEKYLTNKSFVRFINDRTKRMAKEIGIQRKVTTIVARHSYSTQMKRSGASTEMIQESLGHTDVRTTENYLDSFESDVKKQLAASLSAFKRNGTGDINASEDGN